MPVIADVKVMPDHLDNVYRQLKDVIEHIKGQ
jgi:ATP adenylyltransferase